MKILGLDTGTTTISAVVFDDEKNEVAASRTVSNDFFISTENEWEKLQDADGIVRKAQETLDELLSEYADTGVIGLTGQMHGIVYTDEKGNAVSPLFTWQDGRGNLACETDKPLYTQLKELTGRNVSSGYGLVTHIWNIKNNSVPEGAEKLCTIGDYLGMKLTGREKPVIHISNAASLGFFDAGKKVFEEDILRGLGVDTALLPEVTKDFSVLGEYRGIPVITAVGDNQASFLGSVGIKSGDILLNMGTGGQISVLSDRIFEGNGIETRPLTADKYLLVGASLCGGRAFATVERFFREYVKASCGKDEPQFSVLSSLAEKGLKQSVKEGERLKVSTLFMGTRVQPDLRGAISNISEDNLTPEAFACGVFEGMADELFEMYKVINAGTGIKAENLVASGNALRCNPALQQIFSMMFDAPLKLSPFKEEAATGAAIAGAMALNMI